ncbi:MAG: metallophosphoesterase family protein [Tepidiformaceae bacterium]
MRVIHFADLHIGVEMYGRPLPEKGWNSRVQDFLDAFDFMVDYAVAEGVDAVIFAGDAYKAREPTQTQQREFAQRIRRLSDAGIATFLLVGNHDLPNAEGRAHTLEIYRTLDVPNVVVGDDSWFGSRGFEPQVLETKSGLLQVAFLPWPQVSRLVGASAAAGEMTIEQVHGLAQQQMTRVIAEQAARVDPDLPAIMTSHVSVNDFIVQKGSEEWMTIGTAPTLLKSSLSAGAFDYVALGHHHRNTSLEMETPCWYSGSMQAVDFGEEDQPKGFMVFEVDAAKRRGNRIGGSGLPKLVEAPSRRFVTVSVKPKAADPTAEVCAAIEKANVADAIVRVEVEIEAEQSRQFRQPEARRMLESAHYLAGIRVKVPDDTRLSVPAGHMVDAASPIDALETYFKTRQQLDETRRERLMAAARDLIAEVEDAGAGAG